LISEHVKVFLILFTMTLLATTLLATAADAAIWVSSGSGFIVNSRGDVVTNAHVVEGCSVLSVENAGKASSAKVIALDSGADLAVLRLLDPAQLIRSTVQVRAPAPTRQQPQRPAESRSSEGGWVAFTGDPPPAEPPSQRHLAAPVRSSRSHAYLSQRSPVQGQKAIVVGFPLTGVLSSEHKVTDGIIVSNRGIQDDPRRFQLSVPVNPGNSGGPVFNDTGTIIGVVVSQLAMENQGVNFGVSLAILKDFLNEHRVPFSEAADTQKVATEDLMAEAVHYTVFILCGK